MSTVCIGSCGLGKFPRPAPTRCAQRHFGVPSILPPLVSMITCTMLYFVCDTLINVGPKGQHQHRCTLRPGGILAGMRLGGCGTARRKMRQVTERATHMNPTLHAVHAVTRRSRRSHARCPNARPQRFAPALPVPAASRFLVFAAALTCAVVMADVSCCCAHCHRSARRDLVGFGAVLIHWRGASSALSAHRALPGALPLSCWMLCAAC